MFKRTTTKCVRPLMNDLYHLPMTAEQLMASLRAKGIKVRSWTATDNTPCGVFFRNGKCRAFATMPQAPRGWVSVYRGTIAA